jgi:hypothetical protein
VVTAIIGAMYWPMAGLRIAMRLAAGPRAGWLELRPPDAGDLMALAGLAEAGVHDPVAQPFSVAWTDVEPAARARSVLQYHWRCLGAWEPSNWTLNLVAIHGGTVVGTQDLSATDYAIRREVRTGSWLSCSGEGFVVRVISSPEVSLFS